MPSMHSNSFVKAAMMTVLLHALTLNPQPLLFVFEGCGLESGIDCDKASVVKTARLGDGQLNFNWLRGLGGSGFRGLGGLGFRVWRCLQYRV